MNMNNGSFGKIAVIACVIVTIVIFIGYWNVKQDDSYIFYSYAKNLSNGHGYVFNPGEKINATTSPLYTLLLAGLYAVLRFIPYVTLPFIGHFTGAASLFLICLLSMNIFRNEGFRSMPYLFPLVFLANPVLKNSVGMETLFTMMLGFLALYFYQNKKFMLTSIVCALAILARPDALVLVAILGLHYVVVNRRLPALSVVLGFLLTLLPWCGFSLLYFKSLLPTTLAVKVGQTASKSWGAGLIFLKSLLTPSIWGGTCAMSLIFFLALFSLIVIGSYGKRWMNARKIPTVLNSSVLLLILWNLAYLAAYGFVLNPPAYLWYYTPFAIGIAALIGLALEVVLWSISRNTRALTVYIGALVVITTICALILPIKTIFHPDNLKHDSYKQAAEWFNTHVPPGSSIGTYEIGILRYYYKNGTVIDALGLVTPGVAEHVKTQDFDWYVHQYQPDYLMYKHPPRPIFESMVDAAWFQRAYRLITIIRTGGRELAIYGRTPLTSELLRAEREELLA